MSSTTDLARRADITTRRLAGESLATIGNAHGISRERVRQLCDGWGVKCPVDLRAGPAATIQSAIDAVMSGTSQRAAAKAAGVDGKTLAKYIQLQGLTPPVTATADKWAGRVFGLWTVLPNSYERDPDNSNKCHVECRCECGTVRRVSVGNLLSGASRGCGCRSSTGQRVRTPWSCAATGERFTTTAGLARHLGVNNLTLIRQLNKGRTYTDAQGRVWEPNAQAAVPHNAQHWACIQTREQWPSSSALARHLGVSNSALANAISKGRAYAATDGRHYCPVGLETELDLLPLDATNGNNAVSPQTWVCMETGQTWPSRGLMEKHLGLYHHGLARKGFSYSGPDGLTYQRVQQEVAA